MRSTGRRGVARSLKEIEELTKRMDDLERKIGATGSKTALESHHKHETDLAYQGESNNNVQLSGIADVSNRGSAAW